MFRRIALGYLGMMLFVWPRHAGAQAAAATPPAVAAPQGAPAADVPLTLPTVTLGPAAPDGTLAPSPAATSLASAGAMHASYRQGTVLHADDGSFELKVLLRAQLRADVTRSTAAGAQFLNRFAIQRARLQLMGYAMAERLRYNFQLALYDRGSFGYMQDLVLDAKVKTAWLRLGLWRRPFFRAEMTPVFQAAFAERTIANDLTGAGRDLGIGLHNDYERSPEGLEYVVGVFNQFDGNFNRPSLPIACATKAGEPSCQAGAASNLPTDFRPAIVARLGFNHGRKLQAYSELDPEGGPLRVGVALGYKLDLANFSKGDTPKYLDNLSHAWALDAIAKWHRWTWDGGVVLRKERQAPMRHSAFMQLSRFVVARRHQLAVRGGYLEVAEARRSLEGRASYNWYLDGVQWRVMADVGAVRAATPTGVLPTEWQLRFLMQTQL